MALSTKQRCTRREYMPVDVERYDLWEIICTLYQYRGGLFIPGRVFDDLVKKCDPIVSVLIGRRSMPFLIRWACEDVLACAVLELIVKEAIEQSHYTTYVGLSAGDLFPKVSRRGRFY